MTSSGHGGYRNESRSDAFATTCSERGTEGGQGSNVGEGIGLGFRVDVGVVLCVGSGLFDTRIVGVSAGLIA